MARGKYLSLEEARKTGKLKQLIKEHPSEADADRFQALLDSMTKGSARGGRTSTRGTSGWPHRSQTTDRGLDRFERFYRFVPLLLPVLASLLN